MPVQRCKLNGKAGYKWGRSGKCYVGAGARSKAARQGRAIRASGSTENSRGGESRQSQGLSISFLPGAAVLNVDRPPERKRTKVVPSNPLRADPTRSATLRRVFIADLRRRFAGLARAVQFLLVEEDAFGLRPSTTNPVAGDTSRGRLRSAIDPSPLRIPDANDLGRGRPSVNILGHPSNEGTAVHRAGENPAAPILNQRFRFQSTPEQVESFRRWLASQLHFRLIGVTAEQIENAYWTQYIQEGWEKGAGRAFNDTRRAQIALAGTPEERAALAGSKREFLRRGLNAPESVAKVRLLAGRVLTELEGVTSDMAQRMTRTLTDGLVQGQHPLRIARTMNEAVGVGKVRAERIARTEIVRAHAEGQLDAMEDLGVTDVGVMVEWSTAGDDLVCPLCAPMEGVVLKIKEARGMIPRHPNCRCAHIPANVGEDPKGQKRTKSAVDDAVRRSLRAEIPKRSKRTLAEQRRRSRWLGADTKVAKKRPERI